jgi:hypothetical protein
VINGTVKIADALVPLATGTIDVGSSALKFKDHYASGQFITALATGTAPLSVASTTPVANLTAVPTTYIANGTQITNTHVVVGECTLGTNCGVTLSGAAVFTGTANYFCSVADSTATNAARVNKTSGSGFTITGTGTDVIQYVCIGN